MFLVRFHVSLISQGYASAAGPPPPGTNERDGPWGVVGGVWGSELKLFRDGFGVTRGYSGGVPGESWGYSGELEQFRGGLWELTPFVPRYSREHQNDVAHELGLGGSGAVLRAS